MIDWYDQNARALPWRTQPSLYKTVVSEFMLQQTQVKTVLPYFDRWLNDYPDFPALAAASEDQVLKSWEGLGYYSRARNLHKLAQILTEQDDIPTQSRQWLPFPGIGPYAAAAICSIAFDDPSAVVDGNVVRILARLSADETEYKSSTDAAKAYQELANGLLNADRPGDHNQAMMELGATLCHKQNPQCLLCPVSGLCQGRVKGIESTLPRLAKTKFEKKTVNRAWVRRNGKALLYKIPDSASRMSGLHEIPTLESLRIAPPAEPPLIERKRSITKYRITERFFRIEPHQLPSGKIGEQFVWAAPADIAALPFSGPHRKWIAELLNEA